MKRLVLLITLALASTQAFAYPFNHCAGVGGPVNTNARTRAEFVIQGDRILVAFENGMKATYKITDFDSNGSSYRPADLMMHATFESGETPYALKNAQYITTAVPRSLQYSNYDSGNLSFQSVKYGNSTATFFMSCG